MLDSDTLVALIAQWLERELRRRRSWVQSSPHQTERVRGQSTQSLWRITCPPPEQTRRTCWKTLWVKKKEKENVRQRYAATLGDSTPVLALVLTLVLAMLLIATLIMIPTLMPILTCVNDTSTNTNTNTSNDTDTSTNTNAKTCMRNLLGWLRLGWLKKPQFTLKPIKLL